MSKIHDKFVIELAEVIKGYGNDPDVDDPFRLSEFYRFYELPEIAVSANHFKTMIPLEVVEKNAQPGWIPCTPETMPPDYQWYYATCKSLVDNRENWVVEGCYTPWEHFDSTPMIKCGDAEVIAWMPKGFPEPWEGDTDAH